MKPANILGLAILSFPELGFLSLGPGLTFTPKSTSVFKSTSVIMYIEADL